MEVANNQPFVSTTWQLQGYPIREEPKVEKDGARKRKAHKKSRRGCRNCKLRGVKCDEAFPKCKKCINFGVSCNFDPKIPDLQISFDAAPKAKQPKRLPTPPCSDESSSSGSSPESQTSLATMQMPSFYPLVSDGQSSFQLDSQSMSRLERFMNRTVLTIGSHVSAALYQKHTWDLAIRYPYLMHVVQALTIVHDDYLTSLIPTSSHLITDIFHHWTQAVTLFNRRLTTFDPEQAPEERDSLWSAAALISIISCCAIHASGPEEVWPLKPSDPSDLNWLTMAEGKKAVWAIASPDRPDSIFFSLSAEFSMRCSIEKQPKPGIEGIPPAFLQLYGINEMSTPENNVYLTPVKKILELLPVDCDRENTLKFILFMSSDAITPPFKVLLRIKDPRALLVLAYWYAKVCVSPQWWIVRRATLEGQAICMYLDRYHSDDLAIHELLLFPKMQTGLLDLAARPSFDGFSGDWLPAWKPSIESC